MHGVRARDAAIDDFVGCCKEESLIIDLFLDLIIGLFLDLTFLVLLLGLEASKRHVKRRDSAGSSATLSRPQGDIFILFIMVLTLSVLEGLGGSAVLNRIVLLNNAASLGRSSLCSSGIVDNSSSEIVVPILLYSSLAAASRVNMAVIEVGDAW